MFLSLYQVFISTRKEKENWMQLNCKNQLIITLRVTLTTDLVFVAIYFVGCLRS